MTPGKQEPRQFEGSELVAPYQAVLLLVAGLFLISAGCRALNFDESLALRAGWLHLHGVEAHPGFYMPVTLGFAALTSIAEDPGIAFVLNRIIAALTVLLALLYSLSVPGLSRGTCSFAVILTLSQAAFAVHGYEFRYDAAILVAWLVAFRWFAAHDFGPWRQAGLGALVAWLACHHLKGVYFAAALAAMIFFRIWRYAARWRIAGRIACGALVTAGVWLLAVVVAGDLSALIETYRSFFGLAVDSERMSPFQALGPTLAKDRVWWLAAAGALPVVAWRARSSLSVEVRRHASIAGAFAIVPIAFLFLHPHPWPYMLVPAAPFLSLLMVIAAAPLRRRWFLVGLLGLLAAYQPVSGHGLWAPYAKAISLPMAEQVATLRALKATANPDDRVLDPSGLVYFLAPCRAEWYADTLFSMRIAAGTWMRRPLAEVAPVSCRWGLDTYRLQMLPHDDLLWIQRNFGVLGGGILLRRDDPRFRNHTPVHELPRWRPASFWW